MSAQAVARSGTETRGEVRLELPDIAAMPDVPEPGVWRATGYTLSFARALWQRRRVVTALAEQVEERTAQLASVLDQVGRTARKLAGAGAAGHFQQFHGGGYRIQLQTVGTEAVHGYGPFPFAVQVDGPAVADAPAGFVTVGQYDFRQ